MRFGDAFAVNYMSRNNEALWLWLDVKLGRFCTCSCGTRDSDRTCTAAPTPRHPTASTARTTVVGFSAAAWAGGSEP